MLDNQPINLVDILKNLNESQLDRLSEIFGNLGLVFFASMVVPFLTDRKELFIMAMGLGLSVLCWAASLTVIKNRSLL